MTKKKFKLKQLQEIAELAEKALNLNKIHWKSGIKYLDYYGFILNCSLQGVPAAFDDWREFQNYNNSELPGHEDILRVSESAKSRNPGFKVFEKIFPLNLKESIWGSCVSCHKPFVIVHSYMKYCSKNCSNRTNKEIERARNKASFDQL